MRNIFLFLTLTGCTMNQGSMATFDNVDLRGATLDSFKPKNGVSECSDQCEANENCWGYTYGGPSTESKFRGRCYLKKKGFKFDRTKGFQSGLKR